MSDLKSYVDAILVIIGNPYGGLAVLAALSLWKWHTTDRELKKCQDDHTDTCKDNQKLHAAVDGLYEAVCFMAEPLGFRVMPLEWIKEGKRPVVDRKHKEGERRHAPPVTCDRTL